MQNNSSKINQIAKLISPIEDSFSDEKVKELEWFLKLEAVKAVNVENKAKFDQILKNNDMESFVEFLIKYVPELDHKISNFIKEN